MWLENFKRFKGVSFATTGLFAVLLLYVALNYGLQMKAQNDLKYVTAVIQLTDQISPDISLQEAAGVVADLKAFSSGQSVRVAGQTLNTHSLSEFLLYEPSQLDEIIQHLALGTLEPAAKSAEELSASVSERLEQKNQTIAYLRIAALSISAVIYILVLIMLFSRRPSEQVSDVRAEDDANDIIAMVPEGLLVLNQNYRIGSQQSTALRKMFRTDRELDGTFLDFIGRYASTHTVQAIRDGLHLCFTKSAQDSGSWDSNLLKEAEINLPQPDGSSERRYFGFEFTRLADEGPIKQLLVTISDQTEAVQLARQLSDAKDELDTQTNLIVHLIHADHPQLTSYLDLTDTRIQSINAEFKSSVQNSHVNESMLQELSRTARQIKVGAAALSLSSLESGAISFEQGLAMCALNNESNTGHSLAPAIAKFKHLSIEFERLQGLVDRLDLSRLLETPDAHTQEKTEQPTGFAGILQDLAKKLCERSHKRAHLGVMGLTLGDLPDLLQEPFQTIAAQLVRNSILNGAALPDERLNVGKTDYINISVSLNLSGNGYTLLVRDDGEGFDDQAIIDRALSLGIVDSNALENIDRKDAFKLVFHPDFITLEEANLDDGRAMGLGPINAMAKGLGGAVGVQHMRGRYCQFKVTIPAA